MDNLLNCRLEYVKMLSRDRQHWTKVIDIVNDKINRLRINETTLRPAIFTRASYS